MRSSNRVPRLLRCSSLLVYLLLSPVTLVPGISAAYDPKKVSLEENFDPENANPIGQVKCVGESPDLRLPTQIPYRDPNTQTMQELCAKPQYGGGPLHVGGFCYGPQSLPKTFIEPRENYLLGIVAFDESPDAQGYRPLMVPRVFLHCLLRCFCANDLDDETQQPYQYARSLRTATPRSQDTYELKVDVLDDFEEHDWRGKLGTHPVPSVQVETRFIEYEVRLRRPSDRGRDPPLFVSVDVANHVECRGPLPSFFPLPPPYTIRDFESLQDLCAIQHSGGYPGANAGAYCHRNSAEMVTQGYQERSLAFSDELTPRLEWTWRNLIPSGTLRYYCMRHCACLFPDKDPSRKDPASPLWKWIHDNELFATQPPTPAPGSATPAEDVDDANSQGDNQRSPSDAAIAWKFREVWD
ncbi:MAG: hypothetical protein M1833_006772 [Piccolia ochrophora]|nr:MAG: hypothetical protein M1833_006772 [Piccolia ochrophora]